MTSSGQATIPTSEENLTAVTKSASSSVAHAVAAKKKKKQHKKKKKVKNTVKADPKSEAFYDSEEDDNNGIDGNEEDVMFKLHSWAVMDGDLAALQEMKPEAKLINYCTDELPLILHLAAEEGHLDIVTWLINEKADAQLCPGQWKTFVHAAALSEHINILEYAFRELKISIDVPDHEGLTPLSYMFKQGSLKVIRWLVSKGADIKCMNDNADTIFHKAAARESPEFVKYIVEELKAANSLIEKANVEGLTPLHCAVLATDTETTVEYLVRTAKANVNAKSSIEKMTPLMFAARKGNLQMVKCFFQHQKVDICATNAAGKSAIQLADEKGHHSVVKFLRDKLKQAEATSLQLSLSFAAEKKQAKKANKKSNSAAGSVEKSKVGQKELPKRQPLNVAVAAITPKAQPTTSKTTPEIKWTAEQETDFLWDLIQQIINQQGDTSHLILRFVTDHLDVVNSSAWCAKLVAEAKNAQVNNTYEAFQQSIKTMCDNLSASAKISTFLRTFKPYLPVKKLEVVAAAVVTTSSASTTTPSSFVAISTVDISSPDAAPACLQKQSDLRQASPTSLVVISDRKRKKHHSSSRSRTIDICSAGSRNSYYQAGVSRLVIEKPVVIPVPYPVHVPYPVLVPVAVPGPVVQIPISVTTTELVFQHKKIIVHSDICMLFVDLQRRGIRCFLTGDGLRYALAPNYNLRPADDIHVCIAADPSQLARLKADFKLVDDPYCPRRYERKVQGERAICFDHLGTGDAIQTLSKYARKQDFIVEQLFWEPVENFVTDNETLGMLYTSDPNCTDLHKKELKLVSASTAGDAGEFEKIIKAEFRGKRLLFPRLLRLAISLGKEPDEIPKCHLDAANGYQGFFLQYCSATEINQYFFNGKATKFIEFLSYHGYFEACFLPTIETDVRLQPSSIEIQCLINALKKYDNVNKELIAEHKSLEVNFKFNLTYLIGVALGAVYAGLYEPNNQDKFKQKMAEVVRKYAENILLRDMFDAVSAISWSHITAQDVFKKHCELKQSPGRDSAAIMKQLGLTSLEPVVVPPAEAKPVILPSTTSEPVVQVVVKKNVFR